MKFDFQLTEFEEPDFDQWRVELAEALRQRVVMRTPKRTGRLQESISAEVTENAIELGSDVDYAPHVEYGTVHMSGHHMFRMALEDGQAIADRIKFKYIKSRGPAMTSSPASKVNLKK